MAYLKRPETLGQEKIESNGCEERLGGEAWGRMSFSSLLDDRDGVLAFRAYLAENGDQSGSQQMRMWLILSGLERKYGSKHSNSSPEDFVTWLVKVTALQAVLKDIFSCDSPNSRRIRKLYEQLRTTRRLDVADYLKASFSNSQSEVESQLENNHYKSFLKSENYAEYAQKKGKLQEEIEPPPLRSRPPMPTVPENTVLRPGLTAESLASTVSDRLGCEPSRSNPYYDSRNVYHVPTASHNDSEHASQSSDCTSDSYSFTTEGSSMDERNLDHATRRKKRDKQNRRRMVRANRDNFGRSFLHDRTTLQICDPTDTEMASKEPKKFHAILCHKLEEVIKQRKLENSFACQEDVIEDDAILQSHIEKNLITPTNRTPRNGRSVSKSHPALSSLVSNTHRNDPQKTMGRMQGTLPTTSQIPNPALTKDISNDHQSKVGEWLENSNLAVEKRQKAKRQSSNVSRGNYSYQTNGRSHSQSLRNPASHPNPSTLSLDSGLSSTRIDDHFGVEDAHELKGIKERLIQETEGTVETKLLYHFNDEKFVIRVPGRPPILSAFRQKFHQSSGSYRFYFKYADASWVEITENNEPLPVIDEIVEARVMDVLS